MTSITRRKRITHTHFRSLCLLLFGILMTPTTALAEKVYQGFSGGMMVHLGYLYGNNHNAPNTINGATIGIGGSAKVHLWKHLRIGGEGFVSTLPAWLTTKINSSQPNTLYTQLQPGSYVRNGWGGLTADLYWKCNKIWPFFGTTIGGGAQRTLHIAQGAENDWKEETHALFNRQTYFMLDPFVGLEIAIAQHIHLTLRADYVLPILHNELLAPNGPRLYFGLMFCH